MIINNPDSLHRGKSIRRGEILPRQIEYPHARNMDHEFVRFIS